MRRGLMLICGAILLTSTQAFAQSAFMNNKQSGYGISGIYGHGPDTSSYALNLGFSKKGRTDFRASLDIPRAFGSSTYLVDFGFTPFVAMEQRHKSPALGGVPIDLIFRTPPGSADPELIGSVGLELDFPLYWAMQSRATLVGYAHYTYRLTEDKSPRRTMVFGVGAKEGIRLSPQTMLLMGFSVVGKEHSDDVAIALELGLIFPQ